MYFREDWCKNWATPFLATFNPLRSDVAFMLLAFGDIKSKKVTFVVELLLLFNSYLNFSCLQKSIRMHKYSIYVCSQILAITLK